MEASFPIRLPGVALASEDSRKSKTTSVSEPSDESLMNELGQGSKEALSILFRRYCRLIHSISARILRDASEADDLVQDVFMYLARTALAYDHRKSTARSWIVQMTYHRAIDRRRELQSRKFYAHVSLSGVADMVDAYSDTREGNFVLEEVVGKATVRGLFDILTDEQRNTLILHFYEGYTFAEIAEKLDQSVGNVRHHYYRGLEKLRQQVFKDKASGRNGSGRK